MSWTQVSSTPLAAVMDELAGRVAGLTDSEVGADPEADRRSLARVVDRLESLVGAPLGVTATEATVVLQRRFARAHRLVLLRAACGPGGTGAGEPHQPAQPVDRGAVRVLSAAGADR